MTRPRSQQINDPVTRYSKIPLYDNPASGSFSAIISGAQYTSSINESATKLTNGVEDPCPASIVGSATDPFFLAIGNKFLVSIDNAIPVEITVTATEIVNLTGVGDFTTAHRLAKLVNDTLLVENPDWYAVASRTPEGFLKLASPTFGSDSRVEISGNNAILTAIGFPMANPRVSLGRDITRGIVTQSPDRKGGYLDLAWEDGRHVTAINNVYYTNADADKPFVQSIPTGQPIFGRLSKTDLPSLNIDWYSKCEGSDPLRSAFSDFSLLGGGEDIEISYTDIYGNTNCQFTTIFSTTPTTFQDVADEINNSWNVVSRGLRATVISVVVAPYIVFTNLTLKLNGNAQIVVTLNGTQKTVSQIITHINNEIAAAGQAAQGEAFNAGGGRFGIRSLSAAVGETSTIEIISTSDFDGERTLGLPIGLYKGWELCRVVGAEIQIDPPSPSVIYEISAGGTAILPLGLTSYPVSPIKTTIVNRFIKSEFPYYDSKVPSTNAISILIPELMEAGDIPDNIFTKERFADLVSPNSYKYPLAVDNTNAARFGQQARYGLDGYIQPETLPYDLGSVKVGKFIFNINSASLLMFEYTKNGQDLFIEAFNAGNPSVRHYVIDDQAENPGYLITVNVEKTAANTYTPDVDPDPSTILELSDRFLGYSIRNINSGAYTLGVHDFTLLGDITSDSRTLQFGLATLLYWKTGPANIFDENIFNTPGADIVKFTSPLADNEGDSAIRLADKITSNSTIFSILNARLEVTCGDGINSYGDFNGSDAIFKAWQYLHNDPADERPVVIKIKEGTYTNAVTLTFTRSVTIEGIAKDKVSINRTTPGATLRFFNTPTNAKTDVILRNLSILSNENFCIYSRANLLVENCYLNNIAIFGNQENVMSSYLARFSNCEIGASSGLNIHHNIHLIYENDPLLPEKIPLPPVVFDNCLINNSDTIDIGLLRIDGSFDYSEFSGVYFDKCVIRLGTYSNVIAPDGINTKGFRTEYNTGLVELHPKTDVRTGPGLVIHELRYDKCRIEALDQKSLIIQLTGDITSKEHADYASPSDWGKIENLTFDGTEVYAQLQDALEKRLAYFSIGAGVKSLNILNTNFYPLTVGDLGSVAYVPEWWVFTNPSVNITNVGNQDVKANILIGPKSYVIKNTKINSFPCNLGSGGTDMTDSYFLITENGLVEDLTYEGTTPQKSKGNGTLNRPIQHIIRGVKDLLSPYVMDYSKISFNRVLLRGANITGLVTQWVCVSPVKITGDNINVNEMQIEEWISDNQSKSIAAIVSHGNDIKITNSRFADTQSGIHFAGNGSENVNDSPKESDNITVTGNYVTCGSYIGVANPSSGILFNNTGFDATQINISDNYVVNISSNTLFAGINLTIQERPIFPDVLVLRDNNTPTLFCTNNKVDVGFSNIKYSYRIRPAQQNSAFSTTLTPGAVIYGNIGVVNRGTILVPDNAKFNIAAWQTQPVPQYTAITKYNDKFGKIIGAETDNQSVIHEARQTANAILTPNVEHRFGIPISVFNLPNRWTVNLDTNIQITAIPTDISDVSLDWQFAIRLYYSFDNAAWNILPDTYIFVGPYESREKNPPVPAPLNWVPFNINVNIPGFLENLAVDHDRIYFDVAVMAMPIELDTIYNDIDVTVSYSGNIRAPLKDYVSGARMLNNNCMLITP